MTTTYNHPRYIIAIIMMALSSLSYADTIQVTNTNDAGAESLRQAVMDAAASGDTITFASGIDGMPIMLVTEITLNKNLVIIGNDTRRTIIDGMNNSRIFNILGGHTVVIDHVRLQNGNGVGVNFGGGAIFNVGILTVTNSSISDNVTVSSSAGGGIFNAFGGTVTLTNSTISGNTATSQGGGIRNFGTVTLTNSTISGNTATSQGGGISNSSVGTVTLTNSTISGNTANSVGGGIYNLGTVTLTNSIVTLNTAPTSSNIDGSIINNGNNLIGVEPLFIEDVDMSSLPNSTGDLRLQCGSVAIDAGTPDTTGLNVGAVDLLGNPRLIGTIDIGAYERQLGETLMVTNNSDADPGSLRAMVDAACPGDTITFDASLNGSLINLVTEIKIDTNIFVLGNGADKTIIDGMDNSRIFHITSGDTVSISRIRMQGGNGVGAVLSGFGGAILNQGVATLNHSAVSGNTTTPSKNGGGIVNLGTLMLHYTDVSDNTATSSGGGISSSGIVTLTNSTVSGNTAGSNGGGIFNVIPGAGSVTLTNSILSGNMATNNGGGLYNSNGADAIFTNTIISGNTTSLDGGGVYNSFGTATFTNSTLSGNSANNIGGGVFSTGVIATSTFTNTIVAKNSDLGSGPDIHDGGVTVIDGGHNLIGNGAGQSVLMNGIKGNQVGTTAIPMDPIFVTNVPIAPSTAGDLRLQCGSPAIDAGTPDTMGLNLGLVDILGLPRIVGTIDIGAHERPADMGSKIVTTLADDGPGSLRDMVLIACPEDTITFDASLDMDTIKLITEITLNKNLVIIGNDTTNTIIDGMATSRIFHIQVGDTVSIDGIKMQNGNGGGVQPGIFNGLSGGAIYNQGHLSVDNSAISGNTISGNGGAVLNFNSSTAVFTNSRISGNTSVSGGGIFNQNGVISAFTNCTITDNASMLSGGGVYNVNSSTATFTNSTISGNTSGSGGGVYSSNSSTATFTNSTISGNTASASGGGGVSNIVSSTATFINSTISGNIASSFGGGVDNVNSSTSTFTNSTISGNTASITGGGINITTSTVNLSNTIVAKNAAQIGPDINRISGTVTDGGNNHVMSAAGGHGITEGNGIDPLFVDDVPSTASMASTGGDLRLECGSPAMDAGSNTAATTAMVPTMDINGNPRIITKTIDIGAYELQASDAPGPVTLVTNANDSGCGSLRFAVCNAMAGDTIRFDASLNMDTIKLVTEITIDTHLVIIGNGITKTHIDGMGTSRIFYIPTGDTVVIEGVALRNGSGVGTTLDGFGGAVLNQGNTTFANSTITANMAASGGGGVYNNIGTMTLTNNTLSENIAPFGGGLFNDGAMLLTNNTISANTASMFSGGGVSNSGTMILTNGSISGNDAPSGGGVSNDGSLILINATVSGNTATTKGGGVINDGGSLTLMNSIIALNSAVTAPDMQNEDILNDGGNNLIGDGSGQSDIEDGVNGNQVGTAINPIDPLFVMDVPTAPSTGGDLRLKSCSPARDAGNDAANTTTEDILGNPRIIDVIDIGAYERALGTDRKTVTVLADAGMGSLRYMIADACPSDTIRFDSNLDMDTIKLTSGEIKLEKNLIIIGNEIANTIIDGQASSRIFQIDQGDTVSIKGLTIQNGKSMSDGGGILNEGLLTLNEVALMSNVADARGGGIYNNPFGSAAITSSTVSQNSADKGGGIYNKDSDVTFSFGTISDNMATTQGGGVFSEDEATFSLISSSLFINSANEGAGMYNTFKSTTTVSNSSIDSNTATGNGGGFYNDVTAIANFEMSSFADNKAADGGALFNNDGTTTFMNMNIAGTGDGSDTSGVLSITGPTEFKTTTVFSRNE